MKQVKVGTYYIGREMVDIYLREGTGGEFYFTPEKGYIPRIKIGAGQPRFEDAYAVLIHESAEFIAARMRCRYDEDGEMSGAHDSYLFVMSHKDFCEICARLGVFLSKANSDFKKAWKKWNREGEE